MMGVITNFSWVILLFFVTIHSSAADQGNVGTKIRIGMSKHNVEKMVINKHSYRLLKHRHTSNEIVAINLRERRGGIYVRQDLLVFERDTLIQVIPGITIDHVWSPDGNTLVYMMADQPRETHNFANQIGIYDAKTRTHEVIIADVESQYGRPLYLRSLNWAEFDDQIYVSSTLKKERVFRLDLDSKQLVLTDYKGIMFSPDGDYYFNLSTEGEPIVVYRRETNDVIWDSESAFPWFTGFIAWHKNQQNETELYLRNSRSVAVVNCTSEEVNLIPAPRRGAKPRFENGSITWE